MGQHVSRPVSKSLDSEEEITIDEIVENQSSPDTSKTKSIINELDSHGLNLVHRAIIAGNKELLFEFTIEHGADLNIPTKYGRTPLELALYHEHNEIANLIWDQVKHNPESKKFSWFKFIWDKLIYN